MKFKFTVDGEAKKRKKLAAQALTEIRALAAAKYPIAMLFDKCGHTIERQAGDSWPQAYGRKLGLKLPQLREFVQGVIDTGYYQSNETGKPTANDLLNCFRGYSALLVEVERELGQAS
jgi:hypothetical protein